MTVRLIYSRNEYNYIGKNNELLWHVPEDLKFFKEQTINQTVIMGRKTYESLPKSFRPLPDRTNIVLTRTPICELPEYYLGMSNLIVCRSLEEALKVSKTDSWIIGGESLLREGLAHAEEIYETFIHSRQIGDVKGPIIDKQVFRLDTLYPRRSSSKYDFQHRIYRRIHK